LRLAWARAASIRIPRGMSIRRHRRRRRWKRLKESSAPVVRVLVVFVVVVVVVAAMVGYTLMRDPTPATGTPSGPRYTTPLPTVTESAQLHVGYLDMALLKLGVV
jgi:hypothetical protein